MLVLGFSDLARGSTVALVDGHLPVAAIEEEKISRVTAQEGLPRAGIDYCLRQAGVTVRDIEAVALTGRPRRAWLREERVRRDLSPARASTGAAAARRREDVHALRALMGAHVPFHRFEHHLCHASSAYFASPFDRALILTLDGSGDMWSGLLSVGEGHRITELQPLKFPNSLGWLYSRVTGLLGFTPRTGEHKTQWLSTTGEPDFMPVFRAAFTSDGQGLPVLDRRNIAPAIDGGWELSPSFAVQLRLSDGMVPGRSLAAAVARSMQVFLEDCVVDVAERYRRSTGTRYLCVAGGVFLNALLVRALEKRTGFDRIFVQPAADNSGTSLGAAWLTHVRANPSAERMALRHLHLGPSFGAGEIKAVLESCKLTYAYCDTEHELLVRTVELLNRQKMVAWYQDRLEFGFRALGNRSIAASTFGQYVTENLNHYLKRREEFHPFVLSVPIERAAEWFDCTENCRFAASTAELRPGLPHLDRFAFAGRQVRLHLVERDVNPRFHALLEQFGHVNPAPVLVNTSFNLFGEPLVCDPRAAIRSFYCSGIDALVMDRFVVEK